MAEPLNIKTLLELGQHLRTANVQLCFNGPFTSGIVRHFGAALRAYLQREQSPEDEITGVFSIYIELAQNIQLYTTQHEARLSGDHLGASNGIIVIGRREQRTTIHAGNWMLPEHVPALRAGLDEIRGLDAAGLKARYKQQMRSTPAQDGRAGLGLLTVARHASTPLTYEFLPHASELTFFSLFAEV